MEEGEEEGRKRREGKRREGKRREGKRREGKSVGNEVTEGVGHSGLGTIQRDQWNQRHNKHRISLSGIVCPRRSRPQNIASF